MAAVTPQLLAVLYTTVLMILLEVIIQTVLSVAIRLMLPNTILLTESCGTVFQTVLSLHLAYPVFVADCPRPI